MLCPLCNGKTKIVQTHTETEAVIEKCILPQDETAKDFSKYEIKSGHKVRKLLTLVWKLLNAKFIYKE